MTNFINFLKKIFLSCICLQRKFFRKIYVSSVLSSRNQWYISKNFNLYNPKFQATIYPWMDKWNIARFSIHYEGYNSQTQAKAAAFKMWFRDRMKKSKMRTNNIDNR